MLKKESQLLLELLSIYNNGCRDKLKASDFIRKFPSFSFIVSYGFLFTYLFRFLITLNSGRKGCLSKPNLLKSCILNSTTVIIWKMKLPALIVVFDMSKLGLLILLDVITKEAK